MEKIPFGLIYFKPNNGKDTKNKSCYGTGSFSYKEGSVYTGDLFFDGERYNKIGNGQQDFSRVAMPFNKIKGIEQRIYLYVGKFDYRKTDWIYGNGILYFVDKNNKPSGFLIGFFKGLEKIKAYQGSFDYSNLLHGYTKDMEIKRMPNKVSPFDLTFNKYNNEVVDINKEYDVLFIGDSYFDYLRNSDFTGFDINKELEHISYANLGIGGSSCYQWKKYIPLIKIKKSPKTIFINLGFNDIHGGVFGHSLEKRIEGIIKQIKEKYSSSKIIVFTLCHAPEYPLAKHYEDSFNHFLLTNAKRLSITVIDLGKEIEQSIKECFCSDNTHLSKDGYEIMYYLIRKAL